MGILSFFRNRRDASPSAAVAKGRLQVLIAHERTNRNGPEYLPQLKQDIVDVIKKYVNVGEDQVMVKIDSQDNREVLELNITLPEDADAEGMAITAKASASTAASSETETSPNGSTQSSDASDAVKSTASTATASSHNSKGNGKNKSKSSGKKRKGNKKSRRK